MAASDSDEKKDIEWFPVLVTEFLVISIINAFTIAAFIRHRHLCKRSTYLVMNLTVADLLVGVVTGPLFRYYHQRNEKDNNVCTWPGSIICAIKTTFPIASQVNLSLISLERLHATLFPFRHCLITRCEGLPGGGPCSLVPYHFFPMFPCSRSFSLFVPYNILVYHIPTTLNFPTPLKNQDNAEETAF